VIVVILVKEVIVVIAVLVVPENMFYKPEKMSRNGLSTPPTPPPPNVGTLFRITSTRLDSVTITWFSRMRVRLLVTSVVFLSSGSTRRPSTTVFSLLEDTPWIVGTDALAEEEEEDRSTPPPVM